MIMTLAHGNNLRVNALNLTKLTRTPYSVQFTFLKKYAGGHITS
jgi:hypothetical protein